MEKLKLEDIKRGIGKRIFTERTAKNLSQDALAEALNLSRTFISKLENGNATAKLDTYCRIACVLEISLCELFRMDGAAEPLDSILFY